MNNQPYGCALRAEDGTGEDQRLQAEQEGGGGTVVTMTSASTRVVMAAENRVPRGSITVGSLKIFRRGGCCWDNPNLSHAFIGDAFVQDKPRSGNVRGMGDVFSQHVRCAWILLVIGVLLAGFGVWHRVANGRLRSRRTTGDRLTSPGG